MSGAKIEQAKSAVQYVLKNLNEGDRFGVVVYNDTVDPLHEALVENTPANVDKTLQSLDRVNAQGGTNIHDAVAAGLKFFASRSGGERAAYVLFLTDGLPTVGNTSENDILKNAKENNGSSARIFTLGVGYDVNVRLLDKLVRENRGTSDYVKEKEPLEGEDLQPVREVEEPGHDRPGGEVRQHPDDDDLSASHAGLVRGRPDRAGRPIR